MTHKYQRKKHIHYNQTQISHTLQLDTKCRCSLWNTNGKCCQGYRIGPKLKHKSRVQRGSWYMGNVASIVMMERVFTWDWYSRSTWSDSLIVLPSLMPLCCSHPWGIVLMKWCVLHLSRLWTYETEKHSSLHSEWVRQEQADSWQDFVFLKQLRRGLCF